MSGSGGSGDVGGGGSGAPEAVDCARLRVIVNLSNPQPDVVSGLVEGQELAVELREHGGHSQVVIVTDGGLVAGVVIGNALRQLLECLAAGFRFAAEVRSIDGGNIELLVSPLQ